jgi:hypothetical protein
VNTKKDYAALAGILIAGLIFFLAYMASPKTSPSVVVEGNSAKIMEGDRLVLYYSDRLFFVTSSGNNVNISIITSSYDYTFCDPECGKDIPLIFSNKIRVEKVAGGIKVTWPYYVGKR